MKVIWFFNLIFSVLFMGCSSQQPMPQRVKYIKGRCPHLVILKPIPKNNYPTEIKLHIIDDDDYFKVKKDELKKASFNSQKKSILIKKQKRYINFYEKEIILVRKKCKEK